MKNNINRLLSKKIGAPVSWLLSLGIVKATTKTIVAINVVTIMQLFDVSFIQFSLAFDKPWLVIVNKPLSVRLFEFFMLYKGGTIFSICYIDQSKNWQVKVWPVYKLPKEKEIKINDKCKISLYDWPKLQIIQCNIKNNLKVHGADHNKASSPLQEN